MPPRFFITHSWKDIEFARRLFNDLTAQGLEGFLDDKTLQGGHRLAEEINKGLEWCDVYIPILSRAALDSSWCWEEINAAITLYNRRGRNNRPKIISVLCEPCEDVMPAVLAARLYFDFTGSYDGALKELVIRGIQASVDSKLHQATDSKGQFEQIDEILRLEASPIDIETWYFEYSRSKKYANSYPLMDRYIMLSLVGVKQGLGDSAMGFLRRRLFDQYSGVCMKNANKQRKDVIRTTFFIRCRKAEAAFRKSLTPAITQRNSR